MEEDIFYWVSFERICVPRAHYSSSQKTAYGQTVNDCSVISMHPTAICQEDENGFQFLHQDYIINI